MNQIVQAAFEPLDHQEKVVCLACTELPLAFQGQEQLETFEHNRVFYLNTAIIHAHAAFRYALEG